MESQQLQNVHLALCVLAVLALFLIVIAEFKQAGAAQKTSGFADAYKANLPFITERSDTGYFVGSGAMEQPTFWNMGDMQSIGRSLNAAAAQKEEENFAARPVRAYAMPPYPPTAPVPVFQAAKNLDKINSYTGLNGANEAFTSKSVGPKISEISKAERYVGTGM